MFAALSADGADPEAAGEPDPAEALAALVVLAAALVAAALPGADELDVVPLLLEQAAVAISVSATMPAGISRRHLLLAIIVFAVPLVREMHRDGHPGICDAAGRAGAVGTGHGAVAIG